MDPVTAIKAKANEIGFDLVGIAPAGKSVCTEYFKNWLAAGHAGSMRYLSDRFDERTDPAAYFPGARSAVCLAVNYYVATAPDSPHHANAGKIARYALGQDYHAWFKDKLFDLADWIRNTYPGTRTRCGVDTVPVMEKELAVRAGIGWMGKHTCVISPKLGSWIFLGEVLTSMELPPDEPATDHCGTCTRCIDACPTDAITPYRLDASRCISYLTIENRDAIPETLSGNIGDWLFGCDICQDVCPFNRRPVESVSREVQPIVPGKLDADQIETWTDDDFRRTFKRTAVKRIKLPQLRRNASVVLENISTSRPKATGGE